MQHNMVTKPKLGMYNRNPCCPIKKKSNEKILKNSKNWTRRQAESNLEFRGIFEFNFFLIGLAWSPVINYIALFSPSVKHFQPSSRTLYSVFVAVFLPQLFECFFIYYGKSCFLYLFLFFCRKVDEKFRKIK